MIRGGFAAGCLVSLLVFASPLAAQTQALTKPKVAPTPAELATADVSLEAYRAKYLAKLGPVTKAKLPALVAQTQAKADAKQKEGQPSVNLLANAKSMSWAVLGSMGGQDIEALAFLVLMQAAKSAQDDLKEVMAKVKAINDTKSCQRDSDCRGTVRKKYELVTGKTAMDEILAADAKALDDRAQVEAARLALLTQRLAKLDDALQTNKKKIADTSSTMSANLK